ncbi:MAG: phosphodiester glycosidase family protein [Parvularculaceae bacterium]|nr:phosphodiester glycosidase family protein [Parvularculaceae bacterium]
MAYRRFLAGLAAAALTTGGAHAACEKRDFAAANYAICVFNPQADDIRLFLNNADGAPYGDFNTVNTALAPRGERLAFAMNAGMYHKDRTPVGLYVEAGAEQKQISTRDGPGNFHMLPNGVFWISAEDGARGAQVRTTQAYLKAAHDGVAYATQSGPMLVIDGEVHPRFLPESDSFKRRNGVGVRADGAVVFAISDEPVRFYDFARLFRDELETPNALYLDGTISRLYAPELSRNDPGLAMGPIVGVVIDGE